MNGLLRIFSISCALSLFVTSGCRTVDKPTTSQAPFTAMTGAADPQYLLAETVWSGSDSLGENCSFYFLRDGTLWFRGPSGINKQGQWRQEERRVYFSTDNKYAQYHGLITGEGMEGTATNIKGLTWKWKTQRTAQTPAEFEAPATTQAQ